MTNEHTGPSRSSSLQRVALRKGLGSPTGAGGHLAASTGNMGMLPSTGTPEKMTKQGRNKARDELGETVGPTPALFPFPLYSICPGKHSVLPQNPLNRLLISRRESQAQH